MKKTFIITMILLIIITGGWLIMNENKKKDLLTSESPRIEKYLKYNYENIKSVTFTKVVATPMGVPHIQGYVNNNEDMSFNAGIYEKHFETALDSTGSEPLTRTDYSFENGFKSVSEIESEETAQSK